MAVTSYHAHEFLCGTRSSKRLPPLSFLCHTKNKEVEDQPRSRRTSPSRIEVNVEWVRKVVCGDCWLTVQMIISQLDMKKNSIWKIVTEWHVWKVIGLGVSSIWQFLAERNIVVISLFTCFCTLRLFSFLQAQRDHQTGLFWRHGGHQWWC